MLKRIAEMFDRLLCLDMRFKTKYQQNAANILYKYLEISSLNGQMGMP